MSLHLDTIKRWSNSPELLPFYVFSLFHLFPLKLTLLPCDSHMYYVGHKTVVLLLCSLQFNFTMSLEETSFFMNLHGFLQRTVTFSVNFMCDLDKWQKDMRKMEKKKTSYKKKKLPWLTNIYKYLWCGCYWVVQDYINRHNQRKWNYISEGVVLITLLVDTCLFCHCLCVCK